MKLTIRQLKKLIKETVMNEGSFEHQIETIGNHSYKVITQETLASLVPAAAASEPDEGAFNYIWVMTSKPELIGGDEETGDEEWTETNEPMLAEDLASDWDSVATDVGGMRAVILCGSLDDEYGWFWDAGMQSWSNYSY